MSDKIMDMVGRSIWMVGWGTVLMVYILTIVILSQILFLDFLENEDYGSI